MRRKSKTLKQNGFSLMTTREKVNKRGGRFGRKGDYYVTKESLKQFNKNLRAFEVTFSGMNLRPLLEVNAENILVPAVHRRMAGYNKSRDRSYRSNTSNFKIVRGNMKNSYAVLKHRKKFRANNVVFIGPRAKFRGKLSGTYGRSHRRSNAFYAPAREAKHGETIMPVLRANAGRYLMANNMAIATMLKSAR